MIGRLCKGNLLVGVVCLESVGYGGGWCGVGVGVFLLEVTGEGVVAEDLVGGEVG